MLSMWLPVAAIRHAITSRVIAVAPIYTASAPASVDSAWRMDWTVRHAAQLDLGYYRNITTVFIMSHFPQEMHGVTPQPPQRNRATQSPFIHRYCYVQNLYGNYPLCKYNTIQCNTFVVCFYSSNDERIYVIPNSLINRSPSKSSKPVVINKPQSIKEIMHKM